MRQRLAQRLAPFHPSAVEQPGVRLSARTFSASGLDLLFPQTDIHQHELPKVPRQGVIRPDRLIFPIPSLPHVDLLDQTPESRDYFEPLGGSQERGCDYAARSHSSRQPSLFGTYTGTRASSTGYRTSFREGRLPTGHSTIKGVSVWDLILPILQPPVAPEFYEVLEFPPLQEPYPYQWQGIKFLVERESALLGDAMGAGKTIQAALAMRLLFQQGVITSALVIAPLSVLKGWDQELQRWAPALSVTVVRGTPPRRELLWQQRAHVWITNYHTVRGDISLLRRRTFGLVILDECQRIKNPGAGYSRAVRTLQARYRWVLSGTPLENRVEDVASVFAFLRPGLLRAEGLTPPQVRAAIKPFFLRRRKEEVLSDLPEKREIHVPLVLAEDQQARYDTMERERVVELRDSGETITAFTILTLIGRLQEICNRDPVTGNSSKLEWLRDQLEAIRDQEDKALVFTNFAAVRTGGAQWLEGELADLGCLNYGGARPGPQRQAILERFSEDPGQTVFIGNPRTAGLGLNELVAANYVIHFDHWWNPATTRQATDRAHRPGQRKKVFVYHLWVEGTVEGLVRDALARKQELFDEVIDRLSAPVSEELATEVWRGLLRKHGFRVEQTETRDEAGPAASMSPEAFEELVATLYQAMGFSTRLTPSSHDRGVDVIARRETATGVEKLAIQCKRQQRSVGRPVLQQLLGVISSDPSYSRGVLVTTAAFTREATGFAGANGRLELVNGASLQTLLGRYGIPRSAPDCSQ